MPSHADATATTTGLNIRGDRGIRDKLDNGLSANSDGAKEWPELIGLEIPRQVSRAVLLGATLIGCLSFFTCILNASIVGQVGRNATSGNEDQRWCRTHARCPNKGQHHSLLILLTLTYIPHLPNSNHSGDKSNPN